MTQDRLAESIKKLSPTPMSDADAQEAARNLTGFFELLIEIDKEQKTTAAKNEGQPCK